MGFALETNTLSLEMNGFGTGDEHFSAGDEHFSAADELIENACSNFSHTHTKLATSDFQAKLMST